LEFDRFFATMIAHLWKKGQVVFDLTRATYENLPTWRQRPGGDQHAFGQRRTDRAQHEAPTKTSVTFSSMLVVLAFELEGKAHALGRWKGTLVGVHTLKDMRT
jgi:hypothetical protein